MAAALLVAGLLALGTRLGADGIPPVRFKPPPRITPPPADPVEPTPEPAAAATPAAATDETPPQSAEGFPRPVADPLEAQIALGRRAFSCGPIDGVFGAQSEAALRAWQESRGLPVTGRLDPATRELLQLESPPLTTYLVTDADLARLQPLPTTWLGKSQQSALEYETILELVAERFHANPRLIRRLNPDIDWAAVSPGTLVRVPAVHRATPRNRAAHLHIQLGARVLQARDAAGAIVAHFPVSIAKDVAKRPVGDLAVTVVIRNPDYTFDPAVFTESEEAATLGRRLIIPPGPNNPVGVAWIGLDRPGYGIHGTPVPEHVGRTESHGCFRLANWDALTLYDLAWKGLPVLIDP
jgi:lipoprotein-anchoring transpeptidase ErfK/SrfK